MSCNQLKASLYSKKNYSAFTLIELLIVMGILGVLMAVTILIINPAQYMKQARDTNRVTDMETLHKAISLYMASSSGSGLGVTGDVYVSIPSTLSDCSDLGLPTGPTYHCVTTANLTKTDGTGWVPVDLSASGFSSPLPKLPIDPINTVSGGKYYTYVPNYQLTATLESTKYATQYPNNLVTQGLTTNTPVVMLGRGTTTTTTTIPTVAIGESYGGGKVAYILQSGDPGYVADQQHGLIAAASDNSTGIIWAVSAYQSTAVPGGTSTALGTGLANSNKIVSQNGAGTTYAAGLCRAYTGGSYSDWYLPSKDELNKLYLNRVAIGGFAASRYWSSSEYSASNAWYQFFYYGDQDYYSKYFTLYVRCVRGF